MECQYSTICKYYYFTNCNDKNFQKTCLIFNTLEGILKRDMFKAKINKRIFYEEHGHKKYENVKF